MRFDPAKSCIGKQRYDTFSAAEKAMKWMLRYQDKNYGVMHAYPCRHCSGYHFGHSPEGRKKKNLK